jgi:hypothetical protein
MPTITTLDALTKAIPAAADGATLVLEGVFQSLPLKYRKPNLTLDCTKAEILTAVRTANIDGLHLIGGVYRGGVSLAIGKNFSITGAQVIGTEARAFNGVSLQLIDGAVIKGVTFRDCLNGIALSEVQNFDVDENDLERTRKDVINIFASQNGRVRGNKSRDQRPQGIGTTTSDHPDAIQMFNALGKPATRNILIEGNDFDIEHGQGITQTWKEGNGDPRFADIVYRGNKVKCGAPVGFGMIGVDGGLLEGNELSGYDTSQYPVRYFIDDRCTDIVWKGENVQAAHKGQPAKSWPPTVAVPPPPPVDPRIAELEAELAAAKAEDAVEDAAYEARIAALTDKIAKAREDLA